MSAKQCRVISQDDLEEWLVFKIRDGEVIPKLGWVKLSVQAT